MVDETVITVTDGVYGRIYGGGWAEKYGESVVGSSNITVSGGRVEYIYAGGGNAANGTTRVTGNVDIEVSGNASVDYVFLAGKNINCYVGTDIADTATLTVSGTAKEMIRVSGRNACGAGDKMLGTSVLNVETDLRLGYLDFVKKINIKESNLLTVDALFHSESTSDLTVNFVLDGDLDKDWDVIGGDAAYEYIREMTTFEIGGTEYTRSADGKLGDSGYYLLDDATNKKFVFSNSSALAQPPVQA